MSFLVIPDSLLSEKRTSWRPTQFSTDVFNQCMGNVAVLPFAPTLKPERNVRACDFTFWTTQKHQQAAQRGEVFGRGISAGAGPAEAAIAETEQEFTLVDSSKLVKTRARYVRRPRQQGVPQGGVTVRPGAQQPRTMAQAGAQQAGQRQPPRFQQRPAFIRGGKKDKLSAAYQQPRTQQQQNTRWTTMRARTLAQECAVEVDPEWKQIEDMPVSKLQTFTANLKTITIQDLEWRGKLRAYDKLLDRTLPRQPKEVPPSVARGYTYVEPQTQGDAVLGAAIEGDEENGADAIATGQVLAALMACPQSKYAWQVYAYKLENKIILDKPDDSILDQLTVNETAQDLGQQQESSSRYKTVQDIGKESAQVNVEFTQFATADQPVVEEFEQPDFAYEQEPPPNRAYRYRRITLPPSKLGEGESRRCKPITLAVRTEIDAAATRSEEEGNEYFLVRAFTEPLHAKAGQPAWATSLASQKGTVLAQEFRNNTCKITKWVYQAMLASASSIKLGWITKQADKNVLLSVQNHRVGDLIAQIGIKPANAWGIIREILDIVYDQPEDGQYIFTRDVMQPRILMHFKPLDE